MHLLTGISSELFIAAKFLSCSFEIKQGSVFVYEIPCDFIHGKWNRHQLLDGTVDLPLPGAGSGGWISVFHPYVRYSLVTR